MTALAKRDARPLAMLMTSREEWGMIKEQAKFLIDSGYLPKTVNTPAKAIVIMLKGREYGFATMQSFAYIDVIEGRPVLNPKGMASLVLQRCPGAVLDPTTWTNEVCIIRAARPGRAPIEFSFTLDDAQRAGLTNKDNWRKYPKDMLWNRCVSRVCKALFPDYIDGAVIDDEAEEIATQSNSAAPEIVSSGGELAKSLTERLKARAEAEPVEFDPLAGEVDQEGPF